jgi:DNA-binding transcriptional ArsR family regulator
MLKYICRDGAMNVSEPSAEAHRVALLLRVVSDPTRLAIFDLLIQGVQCNCEIGNQLGLPMNLISHHLRVPSAIQTTHAGCTTRSTRAGLPDCRLGWRRSLRHRASSLATRRAVRMGRVAQKGSNSTT